MKNIGAKREKKRVKQLRKKEERRKQLSESAEKVRKLPSGTIEENLRLPSATILYSEPVLSRVRGLLQKAT
jgi:hypothetical protein